MGKVECCRLDGFELLFHSSDHLPPHLHVRKPGTWDARVDLLFTTSEALAFTMVWPRWGRGPSGREQRRIRTLVVQHREELLDEWDRKVFRQ